MPTATENSLQVFHLPGKHNQKDHAGKGAAGSRGRTPAEWDEATGKAASGKTAERLARYRAHSDIEDDAVREYGSIGYRPTNASLREFKGHIPDDHEHRFQRRVTAGMDSVMKHQSLSGDIVVHRGVSDLQATFGGRTPRAGMEWKEHGFSSTSVRSEPYGMTGISRGGGQFRILVPKATRAISGTHLDPGEVVLDRGLTFRAVRVSQPDSYGVRHIDAEVVP